MEGAGSLWDCKYKQLRLAREGLEVNSSAKAADKIHRRTASVHSNSEFPEMMYVDW